MGKLRIELKSDMCVSNGDSYNTMLDGDICYDDYGLPYIPAKRIKGILREAAEELRHIGGMTGETSFCIDTGRLFGLDDGGALQLSNARLTEPAGNGASWHYGDFVSDLTDAKKEGHEFHQQQVVSAFSYIRTMTKIDENGVAEDTSLRTLRVLKRGLVFEADAAVDLSFVKNDGTVRFEDLKKDLELCCKAFRHMGLHRTRGLGEVTVSLDGLGEITGHCPSSGKDAGSGSDSVNRLHYAFELHAPAVVKHIEKGATKTQDYLDGSKIIGVLSKRIPHGLLRSILNDPDTIFSNAYIADGDWHRYNPVPASFCEYKDTVGNTFIDRVSVTDQNRDEIKEQLSALDKFYILRTDEKSYSYVRKNVSTEIRYHHARSADRGMGSVGTDGAFYQVESICEGQVFQGFIRAKEKYLKQIEEVLGQESMCRIGNLKSAEYGSASIRVKRDEGTDSKMPVSGRFAVRLNAPVIMYNEYGMYSTDEADFTRLIQSLMEGNSVELDGSYKKYALTGGFNSTWKMPKPVLSVLDKGSVFIFKTDADGLAIDPVHFVGERTTEGYGEIEFYPVLDGFSGTLGREGLGQEETDKEAGLEYRTSIIPLLAEMSLENYCRAYGRQLADDYYGVEDPNPQAPVILNVTNRLLDSMRKGDSMETIRQHASEYKIEAKKAAAEEILQKAGEAVLKFNKLRNTYNTDLEPEQPSIGWAVKQCGKRNIRGSDNIEDFCEKECFKDMLEQLKYKCTESIKKARNGGDSDGI